MKFSAAAVFICFFPATMTTVSAAFAPSTMTAATAAAFRVHDYSSNSGLFRLQATAPAARPDSSAAVAAALEATKKYGATSPEARVAWDTVEEMDSSDNRAATYGSLDTECLIEEDISKACLEYGDKLDTLYDLLRENKPKLDLMKSLVTDLHAIKLTVGTKGAAAPDSPALQKLLKEAKDAEQEFGRGSPQAAVAWAELEEVASSGYSNAVGPRLDEECLVETAMEACQAIDELNRALDLQKKSVAE